MTQRKITKIDLVDAIYAEINCEKQVVQAVVESFLLTAKNSLIAGSSIELRGFGSFVRKTRKGRENARNPRTGEIVSVETHEAVVFRPGKELKAAVRPQTKKLNSM